MTEVSTAASSLLPFEMPQQDFSLDFCNTLLHPININRAVCCFGVVVANNSLCKITMGGVEKEANKKWSMVIIPEKGSTPYSNYLEDYWPSGGLSTVSANGTQLPDPMAIIRVWKLRAGYRGTG